MRCARRERDRLDRSRDDPADREPCRGRSRGRRRRGGIGAGEPGRRLAQRASCRPGHDPLQARVADPRACGRAGSDREPGRGKAAARGVRGRQGRSRLLRVLRRPRWPREDREAVRLARPERVVIGKILEHAASRTDSSCSRSARVGMSVYARPPPFTWNGRHGARPKASPIRRGCANGSAARQRVKAQRGHHRARLGPRLVDRAVRAVQ
jgi:hypothetical protein